jgi:DNA mismatch endonuclease (patch repair protein)
VSGRPIEQTFDRLTRHRQAPEGVPTTAETIPDPADKARQRRAEAHRLGRHPAPISEGRSRNMQAIRRANTKPEVALRSALHRLGYRFRKDLRLDLDGVRVRPDIAFTKSKVAVFVDGCFWHCCPEHGRIPVVNEDYWRPKLQRNQDRDQIADAALSDAGWQVVRLWEHVPPVEAADFLISVLRTVKNKAVG